MENVLQELFWAHSFGLPYVQTVSKYIWMRDCMEKPGGWFLLAKCVKNICGRVTF